MGKIIQFPAIREQRELEAKRKAAQKAIRSQELENYRNGTQAISLGTCLLLNKYGIWERVS